MNGKALTTVVEICGPLRKSCQVFAGVVEGEKDRSCLVWELVLD